MSRLKRKNTCSRFESFLKVDSQDQYAEEAKEQVPLTEKIVLIHERPLADHEYRLLRKSFKFKHFSKKWKTIDDIGDFELINLPWYTRNVRKFFSDNGLYFIADPEVRIIYLPDNLDVEVLLLR